jgi:cation:H+ antiporter
MLILIASIILIQAVKLFIDSSSKLARHFGISAYTISFLIIAVATSLPEVVVGITSALDKNPILSFGNAIGSNVALLTLVIAFPVLFATEKGISTRTILHSKDAYYSTFFALLPIALIVDGELTQIDGIILLSAYIFYFIMVWRRSSPIEHLLEHFEGVNVWREAFFFFLSLLLLLVASEMIVKAALSLSVQLNWGLTFIGLTITAIGTSLPEIAFTMGAAKRRFQQEVLGDIVGSIVANSTLVLGITSVIHPIKITNGEIGFSSLLLFVAILLIFLRFTRTREKIDKFEALVLLSLYFVFVIAEYYLQVSGFKITI